MSHSSKVLLPTMHESEEYPNYSSKRTTPFHVIDINPQIRILERPQFEIMAGHRRRGS
jgi:hypothetical protein